MKRLKRIFLSIFILIAILFIFILIVIGVDRQRTSYLKIENIEQAKNNSFLIINANIIPMTQDTILVKKMVYIQDGVIKSINDTIEIQGVEVIDAKNKFLTPGLIDMHVHVWDKYELGLYLSNGVTAVRNLWGRPNHLRLKEQINSGELLSPLFFTSSPKLTGPEFIGDDNLQLTSTKEARQKVISYKARGFDFIKTYYGLTEDLFDAVIEQAQRSDIDIVAHPTPKVPYEAHFNAQIASIEHAEEIIQQPLNYELDTIKLNKVVEKYVASPHTSFSPTLTGYYNIYKMLVDDKILSSDQVKMMNPLIRMVDSKAQYERWSNTKAIDSSIVDLIKNQHEFHLKIIHKLNENGVNIICSTDAGIGVTTPGFSIHQELAFYQEAGLSNYEVLKTATVNASRAHEIMNNMGTVEVDKIANLLLLDDNPLTDLSALRRPSTIFINGRKLNRSILDDFEIKAWNRKNLIASGIRYLEYLIFEK